MEHDPVEESFIYITGKRLTNQIVFISYKILEYKVVIDKDSEPSNTELPAQRHNR